MNKDNELVEPSLDELVKRFPPIQGNININEEDEEECDEFIDEWSND